MSYQKLAEALETNVKKNTPDIYYPKECTIVNINENSVDITVDIGEMILFENVKYLGEPKLNETGIFIPIDNSYTNGICICNSYQKVYIEESKLNEDVIKTDVSDTSIEINEEEIDIINYDDIYAKKDHIHTYEINNILPFIEENINSFVDENFSDVSKLPLMNKTITNEFNQVNKKIDKKVSFDDLENNKESSIINYQTLRYKDLYKYDEGWLCQSYYGGGGNFEIMYDDIIDNSNCRIDFDFRNDFGITRILISNHILNTYDVLYGYDTDFIEIGMVDDLNSHNVELYFDDIDDYLYVRNLYFDSEEIEHNFSEGLDEIVFTFIEYDMSGVFRITNCNGVINDKKPIIKNIVDMIYPIGSIYMSVNNANPSMLFGGVWENLKDRFLLGAGNVYTNGSTGGSSTVSLTKSQMPRHTHTQNQHQHKVNRTDGQFVTRDGTKTAGIGEKGASSGTNHYSPSIASDDNWWGTEYTANATATNQYTGGTNSAQSESDGSAHENMPPYLVVYMWKRIR